MNETPSPIEAITNIAKVIHECAGAYVASDEAKAIRAFLRELSAYAVEVAESDRIATLRTWLQSDEAKALAHSIERAREPAVTFVSLKR